MNRWTVVAGAIVIQLCLGAIFAWSVFTPALTDPSGAFAFSAKQAMWIFSAGLFTFGVVMVAATFLQGRLSPRAQVSLGGAVMGAGYMLAGFFGETFAVQLLGIGVLGGAGIGIGYVVPIAVGVRWFPDKKGLITGLAVAGFGFGALIWVKAAGSWLNLLDTLDLLGLGGVRSVYLVYGAIFASAVLLAGRVMVLPPEGWKPQGWSPLAETAGRGGGVAFEPSEMLRTRQYYMAVASFTLSALAGLMVIGCIKLFGIDSLTAQGMAQAAASAAAGTAMGWYAVFNGLGRVAWGWVSDRIGRKASIALMCLLQSAIMALFFRLGTTVAGLIAAASVIGFNFGGNFALYPALTADYFGDETVGRNYGWVFLAYGFAGVAGPQLAGYFKDLAVATDAGAALWWKPFAAASASCVLGAAIALACTPPVKRSS